MEIIAIWVNCPTAAVADAIAAALVAERLAACANRLAPVESRYRWQGAVETATEVPLILKTRADLFDAAAARNAALHPYATPGIFALPVPLAAPAYAAWAIAETGPAAPAEP